MDKLANDNMPAFFHNLEYLPYSEIYKSFSRFQYSHDRQMRAIMTVSSDYIADFGEDNFLAALDFLFSKSDETPLPCYIYSALTGRKVNG